LIKGATFLPLKRAIQEIQKLSGLDPQTYLTDVLERCVARALGIVLSRPSMTGPVPARRA
jgi:hypothetical protein